jgi:hypothetical protein
MTTMGRYCKAYSLKTLREFPGWSEKIQTIKRKNPVAGQNAEETQPLTEESYVYMQENYIVTAGIFKDEDIIFDDVTSEWTEYCQSVLKFELPDYLTKESVEQPASQVA